MENHSLKTIFLFFLLSVVCFFHSNAQIVYTDINPDSIISSSYNLDLNNDGTIDFTLIRSATTVSGGSFCGGTRTNSYFRIYPLGSNAVAGSAASIPAKMTLNSVIDASVITWNTTATQTLYSSTWACEVCCMGFSHHWAPHSSGGFYTGDGYLGLKLIKNGNTYFGWVLLNNTTIKGYAINTNPNEQLLAGQTTWFAQLIVTSQPAYTSYNAGNNIAINYYKYGSFNQSNVFTAQLSDANGSFVNPVALGSVNGNVTSTIQGTIPNNVLYGTKYRVRVIASNPGYTAPDNNADITIFPLQYGNATSVANLPWCAGQGVNVGFMANGIFNTGNIFKVQLSDAAGSFASPVVIGTLGGTVSGQINTIIPPSILSGTKYRIRIISTNPVSTGPTNGSDLTVFASQISVSISANAPVRTCTTESVTLNCSANSYYTYQWYKNGIAMAAGNSYTLNVTQSANYKCVVTSICGTATSNILPVTIHTIAPASFTVAPSATCAGSVTMNANVEPGRSYTWWRYHINNDIAVGGLTSLTTNVAGEYWVEEDSAGCTYTAPWIEVKFGKPNAKITVTGSLAICAGDSVLLNASPTGSPFTYQWKKGGVNIAGATLPTYYAKTAGTYKVKVSNPYINCDSVSKGKTVAVNCRVSGDHAAESWEHLSVYPNPATNHVTIHIPYDEPGELTLVNLYGQVVFSEKVSEEQVTIDVSGFSQGLYLVRWSSGEEYVSKNILISK